MKILKLSLLLFVYIKLILSCSKSTINDSSSEKLLQVCTTPWGQFLTEGQTTVSYKKDFALCDEECIPIEYQCSNGKFIAKKIDSIDVINSNDLIDISQTKSSCSKETQCSCSLPSGKGSISHGVLTEVYSVSSVACGESCDTKKINAICDNGILKNPQTFLPHPSLSFSCTKIECKSCSAPWDQTQKISHNGQLVGYVKSISSCSENCNEATNAISFTCNDGVLTKLPTTLTTDEVSLKKSCQPNTNCTCTTADPQSYNHSETTDLSLFTAKIGTCAQPCQASQNFKCLDGQFRRSSDFIIASAPLFNSCIDTCVYCTLADGTKIQQGQRVVQYQNERAACGQSCKEATLVCGSDGQLQLRNGLGQASDYTKSSCQPEVCKDCEAPWNPGLKIANKTILTRFTQAKSACGQTCDSNKVTVLCNNSLMQITSGDSAANLATTVESCSQMDCPKCNFEGRILSEGEKIVAYKNNGSSCAPGVCADYVTRTCKNGTLDGDLNFIYGSCQESCNTTPKTEPGRVGDESLESGGANAWLCPVIRSRGFAFGGTKLTYYTKSKVKLPETCNKYKVTAVCDNLSGLFSHSDQLLYLNCNEE